MVSPIASCRFHELFAEAGNVAVEAAVIDPSLGASAGSVLASSSESPGLRPIEPVGMQSVLLHYHPMPLTKLAPAKYSARMLCSQFVRDSINVSGMPA